MYLFLEEIFSSLKWVEDWTHSWTCKGTEALEWDGAMGRGLWYQGRGSLRLYWESRGGGQVGAAAPGMLLEEKHLIAIEKPGRFPEIYSLLLVLTLQLCPLLSPVTSGARYTFPGSSQAFWSSLHLFLLHPPLCLHPDSYLPHLHPHSPHPSWFSGSTSHPAAFRKDSWWVRHPVSGAPWIFEGKVKNVH